MVLQEECAAISNTARGQGWSLEYSKQELTMLLTAAIL